MRLWTKVTKVTKPPESRAAGISMAYEVTNAAHARRRGVNSPHLVALVRAGGVSHKGKLLERPIDIRPTEPSAEEEQMNKQPTDSSPWRISSSRLVMSKVGASGYLRTMQKWLEGSTHDTGMAAVLRVDSEPEMFTIKQVAAACGLPQPVIAQLVPKTWTEYGNMYTEDQLELAIQTAIELKRRNQERWDD